ncbi:hypothetical protein BKI52_09065 [marine bacterium AO1-C]|nr:hypothetical protein BKI52_09065 [marine bacterium AO1-C]
MRLTRYFFSLALLLTLAAATQVQAQSTKDLLSRKWRFDVEELIKLMPKSQQEEMKKAPPEQIAMFKQMMAQAYFHFKSDGTAEAKIPGPGGASSQKMNWKLTNGGKTLVTTDDQGKENKASIIKLTSEKLIIEGTDENTGQPQRMIFIPFKD